MCGLCWPPGSRIRGVTSSQQEQRFFDTVSARALVRPSIRAVIFSADRSAVLVQRPSDAAPGRGYAFLGGEYEYGDTMVERLRLEIDEETTGRMASCEYVMTVENRFEVGGRRIHGLEHYWLVQLVSDDVTSQEAGLVQEWLPTATLADAELRPFAVRDLVATGQFGRSRHLLVDGWPS